MSGRVPKERKGKANDGTTTRQTPGQRLQPKEGPTNKEGHPPTKQ